ncbi:glycosyltransferase family 1 protein [Burkholderia sp. RS02]|uniref:glycosyltransferase family 4 protein n=1 Tax=unclassified Burkholderia TaxID=2613784 RepID=UPI003218AFB8
MTAMNDDPKIYFDCTSTIRGGLNTGVQRVVRGLLEQKDVFERELAAEFVPICHQFDWYYRLDDALKMAEAGRTDPSCSKISFGYRDIYLCADAFWTMGMTEWLPFIRSRGATVVNVVYDLIPLTHSQFFEPSDIDGFRHALDVVIENADLLPCISRATQADLRKYLEEKSCGKVAPCTGVFALAPGLRPDVVRATHVDVETPAAYMLTVGTVEPRKGIMRLLDELETVWSRNDDMPLVLVGKRGAGADEIVARIDSLMERGRPISWRSNVSDSELKVLYERATAVICPSHAEGFGLPLAEALNYGKPVYANRLPVFGEFAGSYPFYFDVSKPGDLARLIGERAGCSVVDHSQLEFAGWAESAKELSALVRQVAPQYAFGLPPFKQQTSIEAVAWAYRLILGRELDDVEIAQRWVEQCPVIPSLATALHGELRNFESPLDQEAIRWAYRILLDREIDSDETLKFWQERCPTLADLKGELQAGLLESDGVLSPESIKLAYEIILGRAADADAVNYWMGSKASLGYLRDHLVFGVLLDADNAVTPASINFAYRIILGKPADADAINYWMGAGVKLSGLRDHLMSALAH